MYTRENSRATLQESETLVNQVTPTSSWLCLLTAHQHLSDPKRTITCTVRTMYMRRLIYSGARPSRDSCDLESQPRFIVYLTFFSLLYKQNDSSNLFLLLGCCTPNWLNFRWSLNFWPGTDQLVFRRFFSRWYRIGWGEMGVVVFLMSVFEICYSLLESKWLYIFHKHF